MRSGRQEEQMENKIRMIHGVFGTEMWVQADRVDHYLSAGHRISSGSEVQEVPVIPRISFAVPSKPDPGESYQETGADESTEAWEDDGSSIDPLADQEERKPARKPAAKSKTSSRKKTPARKTPAKKPTARGARR